MIEIDIIVFDIDGTLVDSKNDIAKAVNHTLEKLGVGQKPSEKIISYIGTGVSDLIKKSLGRKHANLAEEGIRIFGDFYVKHSTEESALYPHVKDILEYFDGKRKFISTNRYVRFADATLRGFGIRNRFEDIIGGDDENCMKPSSCVLEKVFSGVEIDKGKMMMVGDMAIDIETGKNFGIKTCWVTYGLGKRKDVGPLKPDYVINDIVELKDIIK